MSDIVVLGAGAVGRAMAADLAPHYNVTVADIDTRSLNTLQACYAVDTVCADLSQPEAVKETVADARLVIGAVPGPLGFATLRSVIETGTDIVDISFFEEDPFLLDELAHDHDVTAVVDCGVAPGMCNILLGHHAQKMTVESYRCLVGGLPSRRSWPYQYKAPFSPVDVIAEYTRPARLRVNGEQVERPAMSEPEYVEFAPVGTLEAYNTDGLRTLLTTMNIPTMTEKTLRYPGHGEIIRTLRHTGFFSEEPINVAGSEVRPVDLTSKLFFPLWQLKQGEREFTVMRVEISGQLDGRPKKLTYELYDEYDEATGFSSMARTTGYTCTAVAHLVAEGAFSRKGICPPEYVGQTDGCTDQVLSYLEHRGVVYHRSESPDP